MMENRKTPVPPRDAGHRARRAVTWPPVRSNDPDVPAGPRGTVGTRREVDAAGVRATEARPWLFWRANRVFNPSGGDERGVTTRTRAGPGFDVGTDGDEVDGDISGRTLCVMDVRAASGGASVDGRGCLFLGLVEIFERVQAPTKV